MKSRKKRELAPSFPRHPSIFYNDSARQSDRKFIFCFSPRLCFPLEKTPCREFPFYAVSVYLYGMKFRTEIRIAPLSVRIGYENRLLALGSCFAEHISGRLSGARFRSRAIPPASCSTPFRSLQPSNPTPRRKRSSPKNSAVATGSGSTTVFTELFRTVRRKWLSRK